MAEENTLVEVYKTVKEGVPNWDKLTETDKGSFICLKLLCKNCPLNYRDDNGECRGRSKIYSYLDSLNLINSLDKDICRLKNDKNQADKDQVTDFQFRIGSLMRLQNSYTDRCNEIIKSLSFGDLDPEKMKPIEIPIPSEPNSTPEAPKRPHRVWTEEQKARAVEARRKTWEAKKRAAQLKEAKEVPAAVVKEESKSEQQVDRLDIVRAIIDKRLEMAQDKVKSIEDRIKSLKDEGVELECSMPDLGRTELTHDKGILEEALEIIKKYLEL